MSAALMAVLPLAAQKESQVRLFPDQAKQSIPKENLRPVCRTPRNVYLRWAVGGREFCHSQYGRLPERCASGFEGPEDTCVALAGRLFCR